MRSKKMKKVVLHHQRQLEEEPVEIQMLLQAKRRNLMMIQMSLMR